MTHNERVLNLLSDGEPHSHHELYALFVVAHSRISDLRKRGYQIECWNIAGTHWYRLVGGLDDGHLCLSPGTPPVPVIEADRQLAWAVA